MSEKTAKSYRIHMLILGAAVFIGVALYFILASEAQTPETQNEVTTTAAGEEQVSSEAVAAEVLDIPALLKERVMGDSNAPIKISEHASFTCGHCAHFHKSTLPDLKKNDIDTGKAYLVFSDFPLNAPAMHASLTARCVPEIRYFDFVHMLFERQEEWAYSVDYITFLKKRALEYGITEARFEACLQNQELQKGLLEKMRETQTKFGVESTPSFVINDKAKMTGALPYEQFEKSIKEIVEGKKAEEPAVPAPATTE